MQAQFMRKLNSSELSGSQKNALLNAYRTQKKDTDDIGHRNNFFNDLGILSQNPSEAANMDIAGRMARGDITLPQAEKLQDAVNGIIKNPERFKDNVPLANAVISRLDVELNEKTTNQVRGGLVDYIETRKRLDPKKEIPLAELELVAKGFTKEVHGTGLSGKNWYRDEKAYELDYEQIKKLNYDQIPKGIRDGAKSLLDQMGQQDTPKNQLIAARYLLFVLRRRYGGVGANTQMFRALVRRLEQGQ